MVNFMMQMGDQSVEDVKKYQSMHLEPVRNIYLNPKNVSDDLRHGDTRYIWLFGGIAIFILILACINFINLSTAKSANRAKEVGLRKVVGSARSYLVRQFLTDLSYIALSRSLLLSLSSC